MTDIEREIELLEKKVKLLKEERELQEQLIALKQKAAEVSPPINIYPNHIASQLWPWCPYDPNQPMVTWKYEYDDSATWPWVRYRVSAHDQMPV